MRVILIIHHDQKMIARPSWCGGWPFLSWGWVLALLLVGVGPSFSGLGLAFPFRALRDWGWPLLNGVMVGLPS